MRLLTSLYGITWHSCHESIWSPNVTPPEESLVTGTSV